MNDPANFDPQPMILHGRHVRLEPLTLAHADELFSAANNPEIWRYLPYAPVKTPADSRRWIDETLQQSSNGTVLPFAIILERGELGLEFAGRVIGSTRYMDIQRANRSLEIGGTWLTPRLQRTPANTECKLLLLTHAFESLHAVRVQLKTDGRNEKSQRAIERIGGVREGTLRKHMILPDGYIRDTVYYSILETEWPAVKARLERYLNAASSGR